MQFDEIVARLNRAGGCLQQLPQFQKDDQRAVQVEVFSTNTRGVLVKVANTPDIALAGLYTYTDDGMLLPLDSHHGNPSPDIAKARDEMYERFNCGSVAFYRHGSQEDLDAYTERMVEFTNYVARTYS